MSRFFLACEGLEASLNFMHESSPYIYSGARSVLSDSVRILEWVS